MDLLTFIKYEFQTATNWTSMAVDDIPNDLWFRSPEPMHTNVDWLVGHILSDKYFHAIICVVGKQEELQEHLPISEYKSWYDRTSDPMDFLPRKPGKETLLEHLKILDHYTLDVLNTLGKSALSDPTMVLNPVASTKYEALTWCFKHRMWHNGQIAMLKRILLTG